MRPLPREVLPHLATVRHPRQDLNLNQPFFWSVANSRLGSERIRTQIEMFIALGVRVTRSP